MRTRGLVILSSWALLGALAGCPAAAPTPDAGSLGGSGGSHAGTGGRGGSGGEAGSSSAGGGGSGGGTGGDVGAGGTGTGGSAGTGGDAVDAPIALDSGGGEGDAPLASDGAASGGDGGPVGGAVAGWYEAEAIPPNVLTGSTLTVNPPKPRPAKCAACPDPATIKPGDNCCSGGGEITWLTQGIGPIPGGLTFNNVAAPSDGMYDVTWWYHCGNNDNFGDVHCGGQTNPPTTSSGCRPHQIVVNGTELPGTYHFPCFAGSFLTIHAATTTVALKAGMNSLKIYPKERDAADMDALQVQPAGKGIGPLIMSNSAPGAN